MKQQKVQIPPPPAARPSVPVGPRYRYFSNPPEQISLRAGDLMTQVPPDSWLAGADASRTISLPAAEVLRGPVPRVRLSRLAELAPEFVQKIETSDPWVRLPAAKLATSYRLVSGREMIEEAPPPPEPLAEWSGIDEAASTLLSEEPLEAIAPHEPHLSDQVEVPEAFVPPPPAVSAQEEPIPGENTPEPVAEENTSFIPPPPPLRPPIVAQPKVVAPPAPQPRRLFSGLPIFRRRNEPAAPPEVPPPADPVAPVAPAAPVEPAKRPRVALPPPKVLTARVVPYTPPEPAQPTVEEYPPAPWAEIPAAEDLACSVEEPVAPVYEPAVETSVAPEEPVVELPPAPILPPPPPLSPPVQPLVQSMVVEPIPESIEPEFRPAQQEALQSLFMTEEYLSVDRVIELCGDLPGVESCVLSHGAAVIASHKVPSTVDFVSLSAHALEMLEAMKLPSAQMGLGTIPAVTLYSEKGPITFFHQHDLCLLVLHKDRGFIPGVREKLQGAVDQLSHARLPRPLAPKELER